MPAPAKRIVLLTNQLLGLVRNGGAGTANSFLSFALAGLGHRVEILYTGAEDVAALEPFWAHEFEQRGIEIRRLEEPDERVVPAKFAVTHAVQADLEADPPDVVITPDWDGPAYAALRSRELGLGFPETLFVVYCHGTNGWIYEAHRKVRRSPASFELQALERASVELADVVVSPSAYMIDWMRGRGWKVPRTAVAPYFTRTAVGGGEVVARSGYEGRVKRLAFFGRLEERKGIGPFLAALNELDRDHLAGVELVFVGRETPVWSAERVEKSLSDGVRARLASVRFELDLDQPEALALLEGPGTLAVMPSLVDNSPNVVYECLERGIPFLAGNAGGGPELVAAEDRARALVHPTAEGIRAGLESLLRSPDGIRPLRPAFDPEEVLARWEQIVASPPASPARPLERRSTRVVALVVERNGSARVERTLETLASQTRPVERSVPLGPTSGVPEAEVRAATEEFVLLLHAGDELDPDCLETLVRAQAASDADVVTCGVRGGVDRRGAYLFLGEPGELGLVANHYGSIALYRRSLLENAEGVPDTDGDTDWVLLASLSLSGARIVSVPRLLAARERVPGSAATEPIGSGSALAVVHAFERATPPELLGLPLLAAALSARPPVPPPASLSFAERIGWIWEREGAAGLARRGAIRVSRLLPGSRRRLAAESSAGASNGADSATGPDTPRRSIPFGDAGQHV